MHILAAISAHGYGHAAQLAPVLNALHQRVEDLRLTVWSSLPAEFLKGRIKPGFRQINTAPDFGLKMKSALEIDLIASAQAYRQLHADWSRRIRRQAEVLRQASPDILLADVPYLTLAAAAHAGIPAYALCSLNWADIYRFYFSDRPEATQVLSQMEESYQSAKAFLCPRPSMSMTFLDNRIDIGTIAAAGKQRSNDLRQRLDLGRDERLILVAPGGVQTRFPIECWPQGRGIHWLVDAAWQVRHPDVSAYQDTGVRFTDLIASCDAVLGKCGYGTVTECVVNGTPLLYIPRPDWPEETSLLAWLEQHRAAVALEAERLIDGDFSDLLTALQSAQVKRCNPEGAEQAADWLASQM